MKITSVSIKNFRGYSVESKIEFDNLTAFVGRNDVGKSTILEVLDIFFNDGKGIIKIDKGDVNKQCLAEGDFETVVSVSFTDLPTSVVIDSSNQTSLQNEYLLNNNQELEVVKKYKNGGTAKVLIKANHPSNSRCNNLLQKKPADLKMIIDELNLDCEDKRKNALMRSNIWNHFNENLCLNEVEIDVTSKEGDIKSIWDKLQTLLPLYTLFQSDRKNSEGDSEIQDPLKEAVKQIINDQGLQLKLAQVAQEVKLKLQEVSNRTLDKIREMNPEIANSLNPIIPPTESLKWADVFKSVSISGDDDIPINKRGSGVKRLILLNFFRAEAERLKQTRNSASIIYAIEEPETSQHKEHQKMLVNALKDLSEAPNTQVIVTTHSADIVKRLEFDNLRLITELDNMKCVEPVCESILPYSSLNEVSFSAFGDISEEYHNELYGFIESEGQLPHFKENRPMINYNKIQRDGSVRAEQIILTEYIRHQIHHPENTNNSRFTEEQLKESIELMRDYILNQ